MCDSKLGFSKRPVELHANILSPLQHDCARGGKLTPHEEPHVFCHYSQVAFCCLCLLTKLVTFYKRVTALVDRGRGTDTIYLDLYEALCTVQCNMVVSKIETHGFYRSTIPCIVNLLGGDMQRFVVNSLAEEWWQVASLRIWHWGQYYLTSLSGMWTVRLGAPSAHLWMTPSSVLQSMNLSEGCYPWRS